MPAPDDQSSRRFWHRDLPPLDAEPVAEHTVEADSMRVTGRLASHDAVWHHCYDDLMATARARLLQELARLGGDCAHVHDETITPKHDDATGEGWLHGVFSYVLYRHSAPPSPS